MAETPTFTNSFSRNVLETVAPNSPDQNSKVLSAMIANLETRLNESNSAYTLGIKAQEIRNKEHTERLQEMIRELEKMKRETINLESQIEPITDELIDAIVKRALRL